MMLTTEEKRSLIAELRRFPATLREIVEPLSAEERTTHYLADEWNIAQIVHHLADSHINSYIRLKLILTEDQPPLKPYNEAVWATFPDATSADLSTTLNLLDGLHLRWTTTFANLTDEQWQRTGVHGEIGLVSAENLLTTYIEHCRAHLNQIPRVLDQIM